MENKPLTKSEREWAWGYAAQWGSYMTAGDPGACMYGFNEHFRVQNEEHRQRSIKWMQDARQQVETRMDHPDWDGVYEEDELENIDQLIDFLQRAEIGD
jgi:hypothetical protein